MWTCFTILWLQRTHFFLLDSLQTSIIDINLLLWLIINFLAFTNRGWLVTKLCWWVLSCTQLLCMDADMKKAMLFSISTLKWEFIGSQLFVQRKLILQTMVRLNDYETLSPGVRLNSKPSQNHSGLLVYTCSWRSNSKVWWYWVDSLALK